MSDRLGKYLTYILRHKPDHLNLKLDEQGWLNIEDIIEGVKLKESFEINYNSIKNEVNTDDKGRFQISDDGKFIRCLQGHSKSLVNININECLPPNILLHGTTLRAFNNIKVEGLTTQTRDYVHLIEDKDIAIQNAERWKTNDIVLLFIDTKKMIEDNFIFLKSENNVWLLKEVPAKYIFNHEILPNKKYVKELGKRKI